MYGQHIERDAYTNGLKIAGLSSTGRTERRGGNTRRTSRVIDDLTKLPAYENRLVTLLQR